MDVDDEEAGTPNGAAAATVSEAAKPVLHAVNSVDLTEEGAAAPLSAAQAQQVVAAMDAMRRARTTATAVVHGWHLTLTVRPRGGQCDMRAVSPRGESARIDSMVKLRKHLGLASAGLSSDGGSDAAPAALTVTLARAPDTLAPALAASSGQPAASPFIAPKLDMASLAEGAFGGLQPPPTTISPVPAATHNLPAGDARIGSIFETREGARVAIGKRVRVYWDLYDSWFSGVKEVRRAGAEGAGQLAVLAKKLRELRTGLLETNLSGTLQYLSPDWRMTGGGRHRAWVKATKEATSAAQLLELVHELQRAYGQAQEQQATPTASERAPPVRAASAKATGKTKQVLSEESDDEEDVAEEGEGVASRQDDDDDEGEPSDDSEEDMVITKKGKYEPVRSRLVKGSLCPLCDGRHTRGPCPPWDRLEYANAQVGRRVRLYWGGNHMWFKGKIKRVNPKAHTVLILYSDGDEKWHSLWDPAESWEFLDSAPTLSQSGKLSQRPTSQPPALPPGQRKEPELKKHSPQPLNQPRVKSTKLLEPGLAKHIAKSSVLGSTASAAASSTEGMAPSAGVKRKAALEVVDLDDDDEDRPLRAHKKAAKPKPKPKGSPGAKQSSAPAPPTLSKAAVAVKKIKEDTKTVGEETPPPVFLAPNQQPCSCVEEPMQPCADACCKRYRYFCGLRHFADSKGFSLDTVQKEQELKKLRDGGMLSPADFEAQMHMVEAEKEARKAMLKFTVGDGVCCNDSAGLESLPLIALFAGARQRKVDRHGNPPLHFIEVLCRWFIRANDIQAPPWLSTPLGKGYGERYPTAPVPLLYRVGGGDPSEWLYNWVDVSSVIGKCRCLQVPTRTIMHECDQTIRRENARGVAWTFYYDSSASPSIDETSDIFEQPVQLSGSKTADAGEGALPSASAEDVRHQLYGSDDEEAEEDVPLTSRENAAARHRQRRAAQEREAAMAARQEARQSAAPAKRYRIKRKLKRESKWECSHCRMGKATCVVCHQDGFVNSEESGLVRCAVDGCGRAYHRACLDGDGADGAVAGWSCPVHACFMCSATDRPLLSCKLDAIMREASGPGSAAHSLITRGVAIEPSLATAPGDQLFGGGGDVYISSVTNPSTSDMVSSRDLAEVLELLARQGLTPQLRSRLAGFKSTLRSALNGVMLNRAKYTSFSRHYTAYRVLKKIAERLNPLLRPGDTFVDFACGQNSFGGLLRDPLTQQTLPTVSFDVLSPAENASNFHRRNWFAVSAAEMPPGELVVGLNPPFGHLNKTAIDFVKHALCMRPRLLVLVMPATNYQPEGYELVHHDDQLCRGFAFYVPGSVSANWIHAKNVAPAVYIYRRKPDAPGPCERQCHCVHREDLRRRMVLMKRKRDVKEQQSRIASELERQRLAGLEPRAPKSSRSALSVGMVERGGPGLAGTFVSQPAWQQHV
ncbi:edm2-like protein1 [Chrysochromulina tobinii]|uniref:Edm2-like protein1 n=1 Tax=Chrysochromulina tobinii TaxID=1460289 RepID=A0A0M0JU36_9EUKA|nr:edm2-like protein1 [Chrysochromulina tobinii]|eukprot:KOO30015.1 edm2-like protein1 [Chrysochromulina sp. CCMP291]